MEKEKIKKICREIGVCPQKKLGQNFLISEKIAAEIVESAGLSQKDAVLEIGAGTGALTALMVEKAGFVVAVEKDRRLSEFLSGRFKKYIKKKRINIINGDILSSAVLEKALSLFKGWKGYKIVSILPYSSASLIIQKLLSVEDRPKEMFLVVQKELADKICASPPKASKLSILVKTQAEATLIFKIRPSVFWPKPKVDSALLRLAPLNRPLSLSSLFLTFLDAGFSQPRKQLAGLLSKNLGVEKDKIALWLRKNRIPLRARPQNLYLKQWISLFNSFLIDKKKL